MTEHRAWLTLTAGACIALTLAIIGSLAWSPALLLSAAFSLVFIVWVARND